MSKFIPKNIIEDIISKIDIVQVVSKYLTLKKNGSNYVALCPFHQEKTPSFSVSPSKQIYHCFGCGVGGNVVDFIMNIEKIGFVESVSLLAEMAGVDLNNVIPSKVHKDTVEHKKILYKINEVSAAYFYKNLFSKQGKHAYNYLIKRGITKQTIDKFKIGYANNAWQDLTNFLLNAGFKQQHIIESGISIMSKNQNRSYDRFRNRIMIPIFDHTNKIIGFGGRVLDKSLPKYLNTPETLIFNKGKTLFGINNAKNELKSGYIIIVEGYMDVISLYQKGIKNVVASLGTSLTEGQAKLLKRYCNNIIIAYDGDSAGQKATLRGMDILDDTGCNVKVVVFPENMDPDEYVKKAGVQAFNQLIEDALSLIDYKLFVIRSKYNLNNAQDISNYVADAVKIINRIDNSIRKDAYIKQLQQHTDISSSAIYDYINRLNKKESKVYKKNIIGNNRYNKNDEQIDKFIQANLLAERFILKLMIEDRSFFEYISGELDYNQFSNEKNKIIAEYIYKKYAHNEQVIPSLMISDLADNVPGDVITSIIEMNVQGYSDRSKTIDDCIRTIIQHNLNKKIDQIEKQIRLLENDKGDVDKIESLLDKLMKLKQYQIDCRKLERRERY